MKTTLKTRQRKDGSYERNQLDRVASRKADRKIFVDGTFRHFKPKAPSLTDIHRASVRPNRRPCDVPGAIA